ncbi:hypothetical protein H696_05152 [Fonticula alba]|uniref:Uncharacterized protein n=1 Tax=Fonticula alba TaxID=691883 RepID=A0A058Z2R5_FONAL|nr:hypothetical protein H696_05152 [Fonticula alba]KCV68228.1 hypothetical protein H696_05152 [Fonticula alba]|eukprot:XP_009497282.1 hypothetical protein H696_05152 [Fonticula alba]
MSASSSATPAAVSVPAPIKERVVFLRRAAEILAGPSIPGERTPSGGLCNAASAYLESIEEIAALNQIPLTHVDLNGVCGTCAWPAAPLAAPPMPGPGPTRPRVQKWRARRAGLPSTHIWRRGISLGGEPRSWDAVIAAPCERCSSIRALPGSRRAPAAGNTAKPEPAASRARGPTSPSSDNLIGNLAQHTARLSRHASNMSRAQRESKRQLKSEGTYLPQATPVAETVDTKAAFRAAIRAKALTLETAASRLPSTRPSPAAAGADRAGSERFAFRASQPPGLPRQSTPRNPSQPTQRNPSQPGLRPPSQSAQRSQAAPGHAAPGHPPRQSHKQALKQLLNRAKSTEVTGAGGAGGQSLQDFLSGL